MVNSDNSRIDEAEIYIVKTKKKAITTKDGIIKINVKESIFEFSPNFMDLLQKLPSVLVSPDKEEVVLTLRYIFRGIKNSKFNDKDINENSGRIN
ncbi:hypothetical protein [Myroides guanonis]|uniref:Uncharacterized protein n=1 Tax=Myroides guanonis TaxID=1150112 RepID=A0A1I3PGZ5_9FLAO|nr:hypothetical protein [Myroides guanonis]SFJ20620.1 hypothetical protein SAMN04487893_104120 [Myroides guanonis]